jgi:hypothetical protein
MSGPPAGVKGTMMRIGWSGKAGADRDAKTKPAATSKLRRFMDRDLPLKLEMGLRACHPVAPMTRDQAVT